MQPLCFLQISFAATPVASRNLLALGLGLLVTVAAASSPAAEHPLAEVPDLRREHPPEEQRPVPQRHGEVALAAADGVHDGLRAPLRSHHREQADLSLLSSSSASR